MNSFGFSKSFYVITVAILMVAIFVWYRYIPSSRYQVFIGSGNSMEPTLFDGDEIVADTEASPAAGDAIVFDCISCNGYSGPDALTKRVHKIDNRGCFWLMGDNKEISYDSRTTGWLCPGENIEIVGVVVEVKHEN